VGFTTSDIEVQASATNSAAGTTTGSWIDVGATGGRLGGWLTLKITNGGTGPTLECVGYVETSPDNGTTVYRHGVVVAGGTTNSAVTSGGWTVVAGTRYLRTVFTGNTAQDVTVQADLHRLDHA
jgi:hypothetical protein